MVVNPEATGIDFYRAMLRVTKVKRSHFKEDQKGYTLRIKKNVFKFPG